MFPFEHMRIRPHSRAAGKVFWSESIAVPVMAIHLDKKVAMKVAGNRGPFFRIPLMWFGAVSREIPSTPAPYRLTWI